MNKKYKNDKKNNNKKRLKNKQDSVWNINNFNVKSKIKN
jgi:hypothetical protein